VSGLQGIIPGLREAAAGGPAQQHGAGWPRHGAAGQHHGHRALGG